MTTLRSSQLFTVSVAAPPAAVGLRSSQLMVVAVIANNKTILPLGPAIGLGCWTPCGNLMWNGE
jgi:hypothetical protein